MCKIFGDTNVVVVACRGFAATMQPKLLACTKKTELPKIRDAAKFSHVVSVAVKRYPVRETRSDNFEFIAGASLAPAR